MKILKRFALLSIVHMPLLMADQFSIQFYNDIFAGSDGHFTNGASFCWMDDTKNKESSEDVNVYTHFMLRTVDLIPTIDISEYKNYTAGVSLSQIIFTPENSSVQEVQYDDFPYVGHLAISFFLFEWNAESFKEYRVAVGAVGPQSLAAPIQNGFHRLIGNKELQGWNTQLGTAYTLNTLFRYGNKTLETTALNYFKVDWYNDAGVQLGNFTTNVFGGTMLRIGKNYVNNFNVHFPYLREEASDLQIGTKHQYFGYSLTAGLTGEVLGYSYIFDEGKNAGYETDKRIVNVSLYSGLDLFYDAHKITLFYRAQSPFIKEEINAELFGGFMYSYQF